MTDRTLVISDLHLGRHGEPRRAVERLRPVWAGATRLIVNGDAVEIQHPRHWAGGARALVHLREACEADGVELDLIAGNHDPMVSTVRHRRLAGGSVLVLHGDLVHPAIAPWCPAARRMRSAHLAALDAAGPEPDLEARLEAARIAALAEWDGRPDHVPGSTLLHLLARPWTAWIIARYWRDYPGLVRDFVRRHAPETAWVLVGHSHRPGLWNDGERRIVNTGCWGFPGRPLGVVIRNGEVSVHRIGRERDGWRLIDRPLHAGPADATGARPPAVDVAAA